MTFQTMSLATGTVHAGPSLRNRIPILLGLKELVDPENNGEGLSGQAIDFSAGTGPHLEVLAPAFPTLQWTATEFLPPGKPAEDTPSPLEVIDFFSVGTHANVNPSLPLDLTTPFSEWPEQLQAMAGQVRLAFCCNVIHITPWAVTQGLFQGAGALLKDEGVLATYGPVAENGVFSSEGNKKFDAMLRERNPEWGIRDLNQLAPLAESVGLQLKTRLSMPANNLLLVFGRG